MAFSNVRPKEGLRSGVQNSKANLRSFLAQNSLTTLSVSMLVSLYACRSASPESLSAHIVNIDIKTVTTAKNGARLSVACLPVHSLAISVYTSNVKLECRSTARLCLNRGAACYQWCSRQTFGIRKHPNKRLTVFFNLAIRKKKSLKNLLVPCLFGLQSGSPCSFTCQTAMLRNLRNLI